MPVHAKCPHCQAVCQLGDQHLGQLVRCFSCSQVFRLADGPPPARASDPDLDLPMPTFDAEPPPVQAAPRVRFDIAAATSSGRVRDRNEDAYLVRRQQWNVADEPREFALLAVIDGMGAYGGGDRAAALSVQALQMAMGPFFDAALLSAPSPTAASLSAALNHASKIVHQTAQADPKLRGMGAAGVVALLDSAKVHLAHVGDCRAYHWSAGRLRQLTKDQTLVQRMVDMGQLAPQDAARHAARNELTQAIGRRPDVAADTASLTVSRDDWLLLACDGLHAHLSLDDLAKEIQLALPSASFLAERLVEVVNSRGGSDNCTVVAVKVF